MPLKPKKPCTYPGCPALTDGGRCEEHRRKERKRYDDSRGNSGERGYDATWRKVRDLKLANDPLCERCEVRGLIVVAVLVHHKDGNAKNNDPSNHESLCNDCHETAHRGERWGR